MTVARKKENNVSNFRSKLNALSQSFPEALHLASLNENRLQGFAHLFVLFLPQLNSAGQPVFTDSLLAELFLVLDERFGGCMVPSSTSHPPFWGNRDGKLSRLDVSGDGFGNVR